MINIKARNKTYKIPNELNELTLGTYQEIQKIDRNSTEFIGNLTHVVSGMPYDTINRMSTKQLRVTTNALIVMLNDTNQPLQHIITIDGEKYQFEKNLDALRFDQFIDLTDMTDDDSKINENLHIICAILYHKVIGKKKEKFNIFKFWKKRRYVNILEEYNTENILNKAKIFKEQLTLDVIYGLLVFFSHLKLISMRNSLDSLRKSEAAANQE